MHAMRLSSGVPGFDSLVQGGIPSGAAVVVQGPAGGEKETFLFQFIAEGLRGGGCALVVLSSVSPARYEQELREAGADVDRALREGRLKFVDWFSYKENPVHEVEQDGPVFRASIDLANVGIAISRAVASLPREGERRAAMEVLSPALSAYDLSAVYGFAQSTKAKLERSGFTSMFVLEKEMHDERAVSSIHQPFDGVVDIERTREGDQLIRKVAVLSLRGTAAKSQYVALEEGPDRVLRVSADPMRERTLLRQEELIKSNPKDPKLWLATARNLRAMGENDRALKCADAALNLDPKDLEAWRFKTEILDALGRKEEAERARERATPPVALEKKEEAVPPAKREDASAPARVQEAVAIGKKEDAATRILGLVDQRLREDPHDVDALFALAAILAKANDLLGAVAILEKLAQVDEGYPGLWLLKTQLHARRGELQKAEESRVRRLEIEKRLERESEERQLRKIEEPSSVRTPPLFRRPPAFFCPTCGSEVREEDASCPSCGLRFAAPAAPPAVPSEPIRETVTPPKAKKREPEIPAARAPAPRTRSEPQPRLVPTPKVEPRAIPQRKGEKRGRTNGLAKEPPRSTGRTNGLVNGVRGRTNGLVNGTRGRTNGLVNGTRGRTNGLVNGLRGRTNGLVNGLRGRTNGLVNGLRGRTNGLVNGISSQRSGLTNGLTNGSGFTNGLGSARLAREAKAGKWKVYLIPVVTIAMLLLPILGPSVPSGPIGIVIDGDASDWDPLWLAPQGMSAGTNPNVDIVRVGISADAYSLSFLVEVGGTALLGGGSPVTTDRFHVFLDTDGNPATGYAVDALGADHLLDLSGSAGAVSDAAFLAWDSTFGPYDWRGWDRLGFASAVSRGSWLEFQVDRLAVASDSTPVVAAIHARAFDGTSDISDGVLFSGGGSVLVVQEPVVEEILSGPAAAMLLQLNISALGGEATLSGLTVTFTGIANATAVTSARLADGAGILIDQRIPIGPRVTFQFPDRRVVPSSPQRLFVIADVLASDGSTLGATVADPSDVLADRPVSVRQASSPRDVGYLSVVPPLPRVDGGFAEWGASVADPQGDVGQSEVDLTGFDARFSGSTSLFYAAVDGRILSGTWVPEGNRAVFVPGTVSDTDRDTVPDTADPYPLDFNNDLVPDAESGGDVDSDGLLDYGQVGGTDWWLNTTIPGTFPAPYAGRSVSVFVGPWEPPFQTRDDILRVFVDLDNSTWTGYALAGLGADRLVEVSGTEGRLRNADYFTFGGSYPGQWSWVPLSPATVATGFSQVEFSVAENLSAVPGVRFFVEAQAPLGGQDDLTGTRGTRGWSDTTRSPWDRSTSFDIASAPILEAWRSSMPSAVRGNTLLDVTRGAPSPPQTLDTAGNERFWLRDSNHTTETSCTSNRVASSTQGAGAVKTATLSSGQDACWYLDATTKTDISAGSWETLLDVESSGPASAFKDGSSVSVPASIGLLDSLATTFPLGDNLIVAAIQFNNTNAAARTISAGNLEIRRGTSTGDPLVSENQYDIVIPATGGIGDGMFAVLLGKDTPTSANPTYGVFAAASATGVNAEVKILVLNGLASSDSAFTDGGSVTIGTSTTSIASVSTSFPSSSSSLPNLIVAAVQIDQVAGETVVAIAAGALVLRRGTLSSSTVIASNQYLFGLADPPPSDGISAVLVAIDTIGAANQAYSVWAAASDSLSMRGEAKILAFRGLSANAVDSDTVSIATSRTVIGTATTSFATGDDIVIGAIQLSALTSTRTIAANADDIRRNGEGSGSSNEFEHIVASTNSGGGQFQTFVRKVTTTSASPSYEGAATAPVSSSLNAELKLAAIHVSNTAAEYDVYLQIWNLDTNTVAETIGSCLDVTTRGDDVQCLVSSVGPKTISSTQVVRIRVVHSSASGTVAFDYDDADTTGDSRATIPSYTAWQGTLIDSHSHAVSTQYNQQRKVVRAGDVSGDTACDATNSDGCWYSVFHDRAGSIESDFKDGSSVAVPTTLGLLDSLVTTRALADNLVVAVVQFDNTGATARTISAGSLELRRGTAATDTLIAENQFAVYVPGTGGVGDGMFAVLFGKDASAPGNPTYGVFAGADGSGLNAEVKIVMISGLASSNSVFADGSSTALSTTATVLVSQATTFPAASSSLPNIIVAAVQVEQTSGQVELDTPTGIEVRRDTTSLRGIEYKMTLTADSTSPDGVFAMIVAVDSAAGSNPTYDVRAAINSGTSANGEAKLMVFRGLAATDTDTSSQAILASRTVLGTRTTTFAAGDDVILGSIQIDSAASRTYAAGGNDIRLTGAGSGSSNAFAHTSGGIGTGDLQTATGAFNIGTGAAGTYANVTSLAFQPKVYFLWVSGRTESADTSARQNHQRGFGVGISTTDRRAACDQSMDGQTTSSADTAHRSDAALCSMTTAGAIDGLADHNAMLSNGFSLIIDDAFATSLRVQYLALGGTDLTNVVSGMFNESASTGNQDITDAGFQPDAVLLFSAMIGSDPPGTQVDSTLMIGLAAGSENPNDVVWAGGADDNVGPMQTVSYNRAGESIALFDTVLTTSSAATNGRAEVDAWLSNGFSLNWNERAGSRRIFYVALKGGQHAIGDLLTCTSGNGCTVSETGLPFSPKAGLLFSHAKAQSASDTGQDDDEWSLGAVTTATSRNAQCLIDDESASTSLVATAIYAVQVYCNQSTSVPGSTNGRMDVVSVNSDGWTFDMDDADSTPAAFVGYWAMAGLGPGANMFEAFVHKVTTGSANPSYEGAATGPSTGSSGELKLVAIHIKDAGKDGDDRVILRRSSDTSGSTWGTPIILASGNSGDSPLLYSYDSAEPSIAIDASGYLHVVWVSASSTGDQSTLNRVHYAKTTVMNATQSELASAGNWATVAAVDNASLGYMPTVSTDSSNNPHIAWSGSKTGGTVYYKNKAGGTWLATVSWGSSYAGVSVDVSPANDYVALARSYATADAVVGYRSTSSGGVNVPKTRTWDGSAWGSETQQATAGSPIWEVEIAWSPTVANTYVMVTLGDDGYLDAYVCTPTCSVTNNIGRVWTSSPTNPRTIFDVAYEQSSGEALLVYGVVSTDIAQDVAYKTYTSSGWSSEQYLNDTGHNLDVQYNLIRLAPKAGSNTIGMIGGDGTNGHANAWIWDGSAFGNYQEIATTIDADSEQVAVAYESSSGDLLALSGDTTNGNIHWAEYTTSWSSPTTNDCADDNLVYLLLRPNPLPTANDMILATSDSFDVNLNLHTCYWDGSSFSTEVNQDGNIDTEFDRPFDFAWESSGSKGLLVYGTTSGQLTYRTFTAPSTWGAATDIAYGSNTKRWVQARTNPLPVTGGTKILGAVMENGDNDLGAFTWDGTTLTVIGDTTLSSDTNDGTLESFGLEYSQLGHEVQHTVCKNLSSSSCDASGEFTKWDGNPGYDIVSSAERGGYPSLATTYESNGDLWIAYAKDVDGSTRAIYSRFLDYTSAGWATAETLEKRTGVLYTRPSLGLDKNNVGHALYVRTDGPQLYYKAREGGSWGADTPASTETLTQGSKVAGTFPTDITFEDAVNIQYREAILEIGAVGYKSSTGNGVNYPKQLDWTGTAWGTPETELATAGAAVENVRVVWNTSADSTLFWILVNTGANIHAYKCTNVDTCSKEDVDPSTGNDYAVTQAVGTAPERHWDVAIEANSGELLLAYDNPAAASQDFCYRTRSIGDSGTWSAESCFDHTSVASSNPSFAYLVLANNPGTSRIGFGAFDTTNDDFVLAVWDGSAWVNANKACDASVTLINGWGGTVLAEDFSDEFVGYCGSASNQATECEWTFAGGWEASCATFTTGGTGSDWKVGESRMLEGTNTGLVCHSNDIADLGCWIWDGVSGTGGTRTYFEITADDGSGTTIALPAGFDWNPDQSTSRDALLVYYANTPGQLSWATFADSPGNTLSFGPGTVSSAGTHLWGRGYRTRNTANVEKVHVVVSNSNFDVLAYQWDGGTTAPDEEQTITANTVDQTYPYWDLAFQTDSNYHADIRHGWSGVPSGTTYTLKVKGYRGDENVNVQVLTPPSTWNTRITISATSNTLYTYAMTSSEYNSGAPSIRFVDPSGADSVQSDFYADLSLVMTDHTSTLVANFADNPTIMVRSPNDATYGSDTGGLYWKVTTSETYFWGITSIAEFEAFAIPIVGLVLFALWRRSRARGTRKGDGEPDIPRGDAREGSRIVAHEALR